MLLYWREKYIDYDNDDNNDENQLTRIVRSNLSLNANAANISTNYDDKVSYQLNKSICPSWQAETQHH